MDAWMMEKKYKKIDGCMEKKERQNDSPIWTGLVLQGVIREITVTSLKSLHDLALDFIVIYFSLLGGKHIKNVCATR